MDEKDCLELADMFLDRETLEEQLDRLDLLTDDFIYELAETHGLGNEICLICGDSVERYDSMSECEGRYCGQAIEAWLSYPSEYTDGFLIRFSKGESVSR